MDLGISGRTAIVCGGSKGLGRAAATALAKEGVHVLMVARTAKALERAATEVSEAAGKAVDSLAADVASEPGRAEILGRCPAPDILINNAGGPPLGDFRQFSRDDWLQAIETNMLSAIELIRATVDSMIERRFGRVICITSHMVKSPLGILSLSNGARGGLTGFTGGIARDLAQYNVTVNNVLPGQFDTDRLKANQRRFAEARDVEFDTVREEFRNQIPARRFGQPPEFGAVCAFLCSQHASFITGQNILVDGGQYPGLL